MIMVLVGAVGCCLRWLRGVGDGGDGCCGVCVLDQDLGFFFFLAHLFWARLCLGCVGSLPTLKGF